jgi:tetratricopeptide (TPR) repeat protein
VKRALAIGALLAASACSPALREPPSIASLATRPGGPASDPAAILRDADAAWGRRPDAGAVRDAEALYLQAAQADSKDVTALIGAARVKAWLADHQSDSKHREEIAVSCVQTAQWCGKRQPENAGCNYWLAIAVGLQAREIRATADDGLKKMVPLLERAIDEDASYDQGGPERILALVLVRAPGWPLGPGDPELAIEHAKKAVALAGDYPPNVLALGEALMAMKDRPGAREAYGRARKLAESQKGGGDPDAPEWIAQADQALAKIKP